MKFITCMTLVIRLAFVLSDSPVYHSSMFQHTNQHAIHSVVIFLYSILIFIINYSSYQIFNLFHQVYFHIPNCYSSFQSGEAYIHICYFMRSKSQSTKPVSKYLVSTLYTQYNYNVENTMSTIKNVINSFGHIMVCRQQDSSRKLW